MKQILIQLLSVLLLIMNIKSKVIPMAFIHQSLMKSNDVEIGVLERDTLDHHQIQFGPSQKRLEDLYKIIMNMMIPCVKSLRNIEPIIRHKFARMGINVTEEEIAALMIMSDDIDIVNNVNACEGRLFGQPPLPWMS